MFYRIPHVRRVVALLLTLILQPAQAAEGGLTLRQAIDAALARNPELAAFAFELRAQDARTQQAALRPALEASIEGENMLGTGEVSGTDAAELTLALSGVLELGGKRDARVATARAQRGLFETQRQAQQLDVLAEVTRRFVAVAAAQERVRLARRAGELAAETVAVSERRVNAAKTPHVELDRANVAQDRAKLGERHAEVELDNARTRLAAMWGENRPVVDDRPFTDVDADFYALPDIADFASLLPQLQGNPDLQLFASEMRVRDAETRLAESLRRPDITLGAGVRRLEETDDQALVASLSIPLFSGRRASSYVAEARANREHIEADRYAAQTRATAVLYELAAQLNQAVSEARTLKNDMLPRMEEVLVETDYAYERGRYSYLELVDAQREYLEIQQALIDAASDAHQLHIEIERLTNQPLTTP